MDSTLLDPAEVEHAQRRKTKPHKAKPATSAQLRRGHNSKQVSCGTNARLEKLVAETESVRDRVKGEVASIDIAKNKKDVFRHGPGLSIYRYPWRLSFPRLASASALCWAVQRRANDRGAGSVWADIPLLVVFAAEALGGLALPAEARRLRCSRPGSAALHAPLPASAGDPDTTFGSLLTRLETR